MPRSEPTVRDPARPRAHYLKAAALEQQALRLTARLKATPSLLVSRSGSQLRIASAKYSAGESRRECLVHLAKSATLLIDSFRASVDRPILGIPGFDTYAEAVCAAALSGMAADMETAFGAARFVDIKPWQRAALEALCAALAGRPVSVPRPVPAGPSKEYQELFWAALAAVSKDDSSFAAALERYLLEEYAPVADRNARYELGSKNIMYCGKWTLLPAALCEIKGVTPALPPRAAAYAPMDLTRFSATNGSDAAAPVGQPGPAAAAKKTVAGKKPPSVKKVAVAKKASNGVAAKTAGKAAPSTAKSRTKPAAKKTATRKSPVVGGSTARAKR